jgi:hypothetical protein
MHIHGNSMSVSEASLYSAAQGERAAQAQKAADVRKKLLASATAAEGASSPEETLLIGQWLDGRHSQVQSEEQYRPAAAGRVSEFG